MKVKETCVARGASPFIMKAVTSPIHSPIMKACTSPFITKADTSSILNIERRMLQRNVSASYAPYKARSQLGKNSGAVRSTMFLHRSYRFFPFLNVHSKIFAVTN
jgi:hypothetical protein